MSHIKSILLHLDSSNAAAARLQAAQALAQTHGAVVQALYATMPFETMYPYMFAGEASMTAQMAAFGYEQCKKQHEIFEKLRATVGESAQLRWCETEGDPVRGFVQYAWGADLLMLGQAVDKTSFGGVNDSFVPSVLIDSGKPALILPFTHQGPVQANTVVLAWKPSPQAARAANAALPWLQQACQVHVLAWQTPGNDGQDKAIIDWLQHHDVVATMHQEAPTGRDLGEQLLSRAVDLQADLLVMGCYSHSRAREWLLGGVTRTVLASMTLPVLMVH